MQHKIYHPIIIVIGLTLAALVGLVARSDAQEPQPPGQDINAQAALGTAFNYQGRLNVGGSPANGSYDFQFKLFDASSGGMQIGNTLTRNARPVTNGQFAVRLDFGTGAFNGQSRFLEVAVRPAGSESFTTLSPRTELLAAPYAIYAPTAGSVPWSGLTSVPSGLADGDNDTTYSPSTGLALNGTVFSLTVPYRLPQACTTGQIPEWNGAAWLCGNDDAGGGGGSGNALNAADGNPTNAVYVNNDGLVGIGTTNPQSQLDVRGNLTLEAGTNPELYGGTGTAELNRYLRLLNSQGLKTAMGLKAGGVLVSDTYNYANPPKGTLIVQNNVGIGTASPASKLDIYTTPGSSPPASIYLRTDSMNYLRILAPFANPDTVRFYVGREGSGQEMSAIAISTDSGATFGNVGIGTNTPAAKLDVAGAIRIQGADLAEPFAITEVESPEPGMVVAIDPEHPGQLQLATKAYDRTVAGVISGAGDIKPGLILHQDEGLVKGDHPVALAGRVYVWADASNGPIQPGDLLTTSDTPGHAMKVTDYEQAQGAILGKAMSGLDEGKGLVLVLVSLQ